MNYIMNFFNSEFEAYCNPKQQSNLNWNELCELFSNSTEIPYKEANALYNFCEFKTEGYSSPNIQGIEVKELCRRAKENVIQLHALILDIDMYMTIEEALIVFEQYSYILYTTFSHDPKNSKDKFRIILPLTTPISGEDLEKRRMNFSEHFVCDAASFSVSQCFFFPSHSKNNENEVFFKTNKGSSFDWTQIKTDESWQPKKDYIVADNDSNFSHSYTSFEVMTALMSCNDVHYAPRGTNGALALATICKGFNLTEEQFTEICISFQSSESLQKNHIRRKLWNDAYDRCSEERLFKFLNENRATYFPKKQSYKQKLEVMSNDELIQFMKNKYKKV